MRLGFETPKPGIKVYLLPAEAGRPKTLIGALVYKLIPVNDLQGFLHHHVAE